MAVSDADPALVVKFKTMGKWPLLCQMVFVLKPLIQTQHTEVDSRMPTNTRVNWSFVVTFAAWSEQLWMYLSCDSC